MELYRITLAKWAYKLYASGRAARWNSNGINIIYTASSRSLACLENLVHHNAPELLDTFNVMVIYVPDNASCEIVSINSLPGGWHKPGPAAYDICRRFGDAWYKQNSSLLLKVPSCIVRNEFNILINTNHPEFHKAILIDNEPFFFDPRIKKI